MNNDYIEVVFTATPANDNEMDILAALLCDYDYDTFDHNETGMKAYVKKALYSDDNVKAALSAFPFTSKIEWASNFIEGKDWNEEWEKNFFKPMNIANRCIIHSSFHTDYPKLEYEIIIDPKMAFGTGHHETTNLMVEAILDTELTGKSVMDMGTGTGILAILSAKRGAADVTGIEIDTDAYVNAVENISLNDVEKIHLINGDASALEGKADKDLLLANINRNIITGDIHLYAKELKEGGLMYLSGFYTQDIPVIEAEAIKYGLHTIATDQKKNWAILKLQKK